MTHHQNTSLRPRGLNPIEAVRWFEPIRQGDCLVWTGHRTPKGYGMVSVNNQSRAVHRIVFEDAHGPIPDGMLIDHICRVRACYNVDHLRLVTPKQNQENHGGAKATSKSGVRGVHQKRSSGRWIAQVRHNNEKLYLGSFATLLEAEQAVVAKRLELHTHNDADRRTS